MSSPAPNAQDFPPLDPGIGLMFVAADHLIPLFKGGSIDTSLARQMAVSAIDAYHPESRADYVNVARTIAFSMAALALLGQAASQDITMKDKMRTLGRATILNRAADQSERTMMQRRRYHQANPQAESPHLAVDPRQSSGETPVSRTPSFQTPSLQTDDPQAAEAEINAAIAGAVQEYLAVRTQTAAEPAPSQPLTEPGMAASGTTPLHSAPSQPVWPVSSQAPAATSASVIHHATPRQPGAGQPGIIPFKQELLHHSAIQRVTGQHEVRHPV